MMDEVKTYLSVKQGWNEQQCNERIIYMPNFYPQEYKKKEYNSNKYWIDIACFGAVRPLKNHMLQVIAALKFARKINRQLRFHINLGRIEMKGDPILNNLRGFFQQLEPQGHQMIGHEWTPREGFLEICSQMDIGLQCNFSETFNIVSADLISQGVPVVGSYEIPWSTRWFNARPAESDEICDKLLLTHRFPQVNVKLNQWNLDKYTNNTRVEWLKYFVKE
jgi:hypothetical protein